jgi:glycosyltransferase involved in cell wall biosynthesis
MPKVSVIMPTYNRDWIIERAINSVLHQNFRDFELIIIDDGSTDDTDKIVSKIADKRIIYKKQDNKGQSSARNAAVKISRGSLISYLDSDNVWYPNFLEVMTEELVDDILLAYCGQNMLLVDGGKHNMKIIAREVRNEEYNPIVLAHDNYIDINCVIHKKEMFDLIGIFDENLKALADWDLFARAAIKYPFRIKHVRQVLCEYHYFLQRSGITTLENQRLSDDHVLKYFHLSSPDPDVQKVIKKIKKR